MKKILTLIILFIAAGLPTIAQTINNPLVRTRDDGNTIIKRIETNSNYTIVSFQTTAATDNSWVQLNKEIYLQTDISNAHYNYIKSENIAIVPQKQILNNAGDKLVFRVYFKKIPPAAKSVNIIERSGANNGNVTYFNFYNVSLTQSGNTSGNPYVIVSPTDRYQYNSSSSAVVDSVRIQPTSSPISVRIDEPVNRNGIVHNEVEDAMQAMVPMVSNMAKVMMDAQLNYYKQPGKITEVAKMNKTYFDALLKEGFTRDEALKIITANSILPKPIDINNK